jgi:hypothetical protein
MKSLRPLMPRLPRPPAQRTAPPPGPVCTPSPVHQPAPGPGTAAIVTSGPTDVIALFEASVSPQGIARQIQDAHPGWCCLWGAWSRTFTAWAGWLPDQTPVVEATDARSLDALMREAEITYRRPGRSWPHGTRR